MDPINQKERTTAFLQFIVLFIITIVFVNVGMFFNTRFFAKDYKVLKEENRKLEQISKLTAKLDELNDELLQLDKIDNDFDWDKSKSKIEKKIEDYLTLGSDSSDFQKFGTSLQSTYENALWDKKKFIQSKNCTNKIKELETIINQLQKEAKDLEKENRKLEADMRIQQRIN